MLYIYRGLNSYLYYFGVPGYNHSIMGPQTLFDLYCAMCLNMENSFKIMKNSTIAL